LKVNGIKLSASLQVDSERPCNHRVKLPARKGNIHPWLSILSSADLHRKSAQWRLRASYIAISAHQW